jgi:NodT family efflux transporter outer membrane factor (OMF) lipoprotein
MKQLASLPPAGSARGLLLATATAAALYGCTVGPNFKAPESPTAKAYTPEAPPEPTNQHFAMGEKITGDWWTLYQSPPLDEMLRQAIAANRTLVASMATLAAAQETLAQAEAGLYPQVDLSGDALRQHINGSQFGLSKLPPTFPAYSSNLRLGPSVSYALDVFGLTRRTIEEEGALADAQDYALDAAYLTLTGNAVTQAITIASLRAQIATAQGIIADDETNLDLVNREVAAGVATQLDIETASSQLATDRTLLPPLDQQLEVARHALAVLLGRTTADYTPPDFDLEKLALPADLPVSLPSDLVRQRPDILSSEAQLHAASAAIGVATAQLYPQITLTANVAQFAISPDAFFSSANNVWSIAGGLTQPIFHGGALEAGRRRAVDNFNAALATYEQTVLQSFAQVADTLEALSHDSSLLAAQQQAVESTQRSLDLTRRAYTLGSVGILQVVDAERLLEQARLGEVRARAQRYLDTAQLFVALGGGWWNWHQASTDSN